MYSIGCLSNCLCGVCVGNMIVRIGSNLGTWKLTVGRFHALLLISISC